MKIGNKNKVEKLVIFSIATIMCLSILMFLPTATAADYYVNPGDDIQAVINSAGNYDTIHFNPGTYYLTATITISKPLTLSGPQFGIDPRPFIGSTRTPGSLSEAIIDGNGVAQIFYIDANDVTIDGLEVLDGTADLVRQSNAHSGTIVRNLIVHHATGDEGIQLSSCTNGLIEKNYVFDVAQDGVNFADSSNCVLQNNEITTSNSENAAIYVYGSEEITIIGNYIHDTTAANGIELYDNSGDIDIINNLVADNSWMIKSQHEAYSGNGILGYKPTATGYTVTIAHNTIVNNMVSSSSAYHYTQVGFGNGIELNTNAGIDGAINIYNNIIAFNGLPSYGWGVITKTYEGFPGPSTVNVDFNDIYNNGAGTCSGTCTVGSNNIYVNPLFVNAGLFDYHLQSSSPCVNTATPLGIITDIEGTPRDTTPDRGAYEYFYSCPAICIRTRDSVEFCTIQAAIDDANTINGDTIQVYPGTYTENAHNWVDIDVYKELTIKGQAGSSGTIIELNERNNPVGAHMDGVSISASNVKIQGFTFTKKLTAPYASGFNIRAGINVHTPPPANTFNNITLQDVVSEYSYGSNVIFDGAYTYNNVKIIDCNIHHSYTERCFYESPNTIINGFTVTNSHFDNAGYGISTSGDPIGFNLQGTTTNLQIIGGTFNENPNGGIGIRRTTNAIITGVSVVHSGYEASGTRSGIGIWEDMSTTSNVQINNPTVTNCGGRGLMFGTWGKTVQDITVTGGTISGSGNIGCMLYTGGAGGLIQRIKYTGVTVTNSGSHNMLFQEDDSSGASTCRYVNVTQSTITNSLGKGVYYYGMNVAGSLVNYNNIDNNVAGVFNVAGTGILDATCNWWGDISGPGGVGPGIGDTVSTNVIYCPWLNAAYPLGTCTGGTVCWNTRTGEYFCTIQKAIDDSDTIDGDTIEVFAGTHPGNIIVYKELTIKSQSGAAVTIINASKIDYSGYKNAWGYGINYAWAQTYDPGLLKNGFMIWKDDVTIDGFKIINALWPSQYNRGIGILIGSIHTTYAGFIPWNIDQWGGLIWPVDEPTPTGVVIKNNIIDAASDGIYNWASNGNTFEYNTILNSVAVGGSGISCYEGGTNNIIRYNTFDNCDGAAVSICGAWPDVLLDVSNTQIYNNNISNSGDGIQFYNTYGSNVHAYNNNILGNNKGVVVEGVGGALVSHANYNNIVGNTIGIENTAPDGVFDAECNWYGNILGPTHSSNPYGVGDSVSDNVDFLPWLNLPFEDPNTVCEMGLCQDIVYVDDDYKTDEPGYYIDHFPTIQMALDRLDAGGTVIIYDGVYDEDLIIDDYPCDNTGITIMGAYECFPTDEAAVIQGHAIISVNDVTIKYLEFTPTTDAAITVEAGVTGTTLEWNKFRRDCITDAIGVQALGSSIVDAEHNWWGAQDGPNGGMMDDGKTPDGNGVKLIGEVLVEPWIGIHAEIAEPIGTIEVSLGTPVTFDATGSFAYSFGDCSELTALPMQYLWDFGDGSQSANMVAIHAFEQAGTYEVALMVDSAGIPGLYSNFMYDWAYVTVHVVTEDTALTVNADGGNLGGYETIVNEPIQLNGDAFGGNGEYIWHWNFGDQTGDSNMQNPIHTYTKPGTYTATLTVISSDGETATDTAQVRVYDIDELFVTINDANTIAGIETMFAASIKGGTSPYTVSWDFGDGSTSQENRPTHIYSSPGEYTITVTVTDSKQKTDQDTAKITVEEENIIEEAEIKEVKAGLGVKAVIAAGGNNCNWEIAVEGKVFLGGENSGTIEANTQETVKLGFSIAIGNVNIIVKAAGIQKEYTAFALGPLYLNLQEV